MEKRSSGGVAKLCTLDMQSYLEVMGRQLDEIQAQHHQFYASRQDRLGRLRSQEHPGHLVKRWSSESHAAPQQPGGLPPEYPARRGDFHVDGDRQELGLPSVGDSSGAVPPSTASQSGARRSLLFADGPLRTSDSAPASIRSPPGDGEVTSLACTVAAPGGAPALQRCSDLSAMVQAQARVTATQQSSESPSASESTSTPSANALYDTSGTPSTHLEQPKAATALGGSPLGTASSVRTTPLGADAAYDASVSYTTPDSHDVDYPLTASGSSSSQGTWHQSGAAVVSPSSSPGIQIPRGAAAAASIPSVDSSRGTQSPEVAADIEAGSEVLSEDGISPYTVALAGRPFDGVDSEEDDGSQPDDNAHTSMNLHTDGPGHPQTSAEEVGGSSWRAMQSSDGGNEQEILSATSQLHRAAGGPTSRPQPSTGARAPLVVASLETEEALRALLATPRFAMSGSGTVTASIDVEGLEVPADVLAALAKTDGMDLDAALGAAMGISLREHDVQEQTGALTAPSTKQAQGTGGFAQAGQGRHMVLGPGALTAAPVAVPLAVTARGFDTSVRSAGGASVRAASVAGTVPSAAFPPRGAGHPPQQLDRPAAHIDASIEVGPMDMLSQTMEVSVEGGGLSASLIRGSTTCAALVAAQVAAAQQHSQPVLYSLAPKPSIPIDKSSRRNTLDGEDRRITLDGGSRCSTVGGGSRRNTTDGCPQLNAGPGAGPVLGSEHPHARFHSGAPSAVVTTIAEFNNAVRSELWPVGESPSAGVAASNQATAHACEGFATTASPGRGFRGIAHAGSPSAASSVVRQGGDGDTVLYGSPSQKVDPGASPGATVSPYMHPSPPQGADPSPYMSSPTVSHVSSRLQRNSRKMDQASVAGMGGGTDAGRSQAGADDVVGSTGSAAAGLRPWSAASGSGSRRQLAQTCASGTSCVPNSIHLDLSLTQAAAAAATGGVRTVAAGVQQYTSAAALSTVVSQRHLRAQQHLPLLHKQQPEQQPAPPFVEVSQVPAYSSFSLTGLSPPSHPLTEVVLHELGMDGVGCPMQLLLAAKEASVVTAPVLVEPSDCNRASRQLQPLGPPLAAFSRAAALAAAADVGMAAPPPAMDRRPGPPAAPPPSNRAGPVESVTTRPPDTGATARASSTRALNAGYSVDTSDDASTAWTQPHGPAKRAAPAQVDISADRRHPHPEHPESPGPPFMASSAAKLSQLKARRQQQWQSQHGLQGSQSVLMVAGTPTPQQPGALHREQHSFDLHHTGRSQMRGASVVDRNNCGASSGWTSGPLTRSGPSDDPPNAAVPEAHSRSPLPATVSSHLLPNAVAEATARAICSKQEAAVTGELHQAHGMSGLSVAIEPGQVKWAWQTDANGKPNPGRLNASAEVSPSPGTCSSSSGSPWTSPAGAYAAIRDSSTEWALQQLPPPQWQRHGHLPVGAHSWKPQQEQEKSDAEEKPLAPQPRQQVGQFANTRRQSDYGGADRQVASAGGGTREHNYAVNSGGSSAQEQTQLRGPSATEGGGQPNPKALALLRLKQQSIMRHNVQVSSVKESDGQPEVAEQAQQGAPVVQQLPRSRSSSAGTHQFGQPRQLTRQVSAPRPQHVAEQGDSRQRGSRSEVPEAEDVETGGGEGGDLQPKPFLRRRSAKVEARKVDWSYVKPRTNSRNPDYYGDQNSPDAMMKARVSPLTTPKGGIAKPPLNVNVYARAKKPGIKLPLTPTDEARTPGVPARRRLSNIPPAPSGMPWPGRAAEERRDSSNGPGRAGGGALSPLDDLLAHVNTLLRDFDKIVV